MQAKLLTDIYCGATHRYSFIVSNQSIRYGNGICDYFDESKENDGNTLAWALPDITGSTLAGTGNRRRALDGYEVKQA